MSEAEYRAEWLSSRNADPSWVIVTVAEVADAKAEFAKLALCVAALEAENRHQWAMRSVASYSDPLDPRILAGRREVERTCHEAAQLRREALQALQALEL